MVSLRAFYSNDASSSLYFKVFLCGKRGPFWAVVVAQLAELLLPILSKVQIQSSVEFYNEHIYCLMLKRRNKEKRAREWQIAEKDV